MIQLIDLIEITLYISALYCIYALVRNFLSYRFRRISILLIPLIALGIMVLKSQMIQSNQVITLEVIELDPITVGAEATNVSSFFSWSFMYWLGFVMVLLFLTFRLWKIRNHLRGAKKVAGENVYLKETIHQNSFSFFNFIHLSAGLDEREKSVVLEHEMHHVKNYHSIDLILAEVYHALFWFNPLLFWVKKELVETHEFEVDQAMYQKHQTNYMEVLLAYSLGTASSQLVLTSQFYNKLSLAKRFKKMKTPIKFKNGFFAAIPLLALSLSLFSWTTVQNENQTDNFPAVLQKDDGKVYETVDKEPKFKGGQEALIAYISKAVKYPDKAQKDGIEGTVYVGFVVNKDGSVSDAKVVKGVNDLLDQEALNAIKSMPNWIPGEKDGEPVRAQMTVPITFKL